MHRGESIGTLLGVGKRSALVKRREVSGDQDNLTQGGIRVSGQREEADGSCQDHWHLPARLVFSVFSVHSSRLSELFKDQ